MKTGGRLARCPLKGTISDAIFAVLYGCRQNIHKILAHLRALLPSVVTLVLALLQQEKFRQYSPPAAGPRCSG
ncbi:hypothetical protein EV216_12441 [Rhodovulum steppense]|uniref:DDE family transposase n=1 Tax=Rhodovulum steppense TaxID=540251 RepID=A0A4R1YMQ3_9RHOB|nr:hypothetical protein EV216_12441 [Rhodovulum steppense]